MARSPLLNLYDPYGILEEQAKLGLLPGGDPLNPSRRLTISDLMPQEEEKGLLRTLSEMGTSGLAFAGDILDTPGAFIRGILAGKPLSFLGENISGQRRVTGRDLLRQAGAIGDEDTWWNFAGGLAGEILLDPLTYLNPLAILGKGAATNLGKAASKAGITRNAREAAEKLGVGTREALQTRGAKDFLSLLPDELQGEARNRFVGLAEKYTGKKLDTAEAIEEALSSPLAADMTFSIPGTNVNVPINMGLGRRADKAADFLRGSPITGPMMARTAALFSSPTQGVYLPDLEQTNAVQKTARQAYRQAESGAELVRSRVGRLLAEVQLGDFADDIPTELRDPYSRRFQRFVNTAVEDPDWARQLDPEAAKAFAASEPLANFLEFARTSAKESMEEQIAAGLKAQPFQSRNWRTASGDPMGFISRQRYNFNREMLPKATDLEGKPYRKSSKIFGVGTPDRNPAFDFPQALMDRFVDGSYKAKNPKTGELANLQEVLQNVSNRDAAGIIDEAYRSITGREGGLYDTFVEGQLEALGKQAADAGTPLTPMQFAEAAEKLRGGELLTFYEDLADTIRNADLQFAKTGTGYFDSDLTNNLVQNLVSGKRSVANADALFDALKSVTVERAAGNIEAGGYAPLAYAAEALGLDPNSQRFKTVFKGDRAKSMSVPKSALKALQSLAPATATTEPVLGLKTLYDSFTTAFKVGALANPAFHTRNLYSGLINNASLGSFNPLDPRSYRDYYAAFRASRGDYSSLMKVLRDSPVYRNLPDDKSRLVKFMGDVAGQRLVQGNVIDDIGESTATKLLPGKDRKPDTLPRTAAERVRDFFTLRGTRFAGRPVLENTNPLLRFNDAVGQGVEDTLRLGTFINQARQGASAQAAGDLSRLANLDYSPQAFTSFERQWLKKIFPFYSFQRKIVDSVADNMLYRPGGVQNQMIRAINRGGQPTEDQFVPEYLRQSAAIPTPYRPGEGLQRYVNLSGSLPFESTFNLITPGVGGSLSTRLGDTIGKTASNIAGQMNPLFKYLIETATGKQLYTGRNLSDLYSSLEQDIGPAGRNIENLVRNLVPGGSKLASLYQGIRDDRLSMEDRLTKLAINNLTGVRFTDIDQEASRSRAARDMLDQILQGTPGTRVYENISVPEEALQAMTPEQQRLYLLYRSLQSQAQKRARERKKQEEAAALLGGLQT